MTALTKAFNAISDAQVDPDSPIDTTLLTSIRDALIYLQEWIGHDYVAGAVQNHNHDGINSASIPVGPNYLRNGSFESGLSGWTTTPFTGGTVGLNTTAAYVNDGAQSLAITSTVLADGGGTAQTDEYVPCTGGQGYGVIGDVLASVAGVSGKIEIEWYDATQALISSSSIYNSASVPTAYAKFGTFVTAPSTARFMRILCTGGIPATGTAVGTVYFDGLLSFALPQLPSGTTAVTQGIGNNSTLLSTTAYADTHVPKDVGNVGVGAFCLGANSSTTVVAAGATKAGSGIYSYFYGANNSYLNSNYNSSLAVGTWRNVGNTSSYYDGSSNYYYTMWQRIS